VADFDSLPPGTFCWPELATTDQQSAVAFYRGLFGWDVHTLPIGPTETYSMFEMRGRPLGAACTLRAEEKGVPPHWGSFISVTSADETVSRAKELGAKVFAPPFDVGDSGRMAVLQDPTGAVFHVWQPKTHIGARILNEPGALCWTELATRDTKAAEAFYTRLFGWAAKHGSPDSPMEYTEFSIGGQPSIGMMPMPAQVPGFVPAYWMPYFQVADCDAIAAKGQALGGKLTVPPTDIPGTGRFAIVCDLQGAMFAVFSPRQH